jgi:pSer/pThr/pTyr-binding forkhead associated (FHA) protein
MHVITPIQAQRTVRLGRGHDSDLRINDISVSRQHAVIRFKNDGFYLQDNMSKFGTLVLVRKRLPLSVSITQAV